MDPQGYNPTYKAFLRSEALFDLRYPLWVAVLDRRTQVLLMKDQDIPLDPQKTMAKWSM